MDFDGVSSVLSFTTVVSGECFVSVTRVFSGSKHFISVLELVSDF